MLCYSIGAESGDEGSEQGEEDNSEDYETDSGSEENGNENKMDIIDMTETDVVNLRRTIYLTIMSSLDFEEAGHKLLKIKINPGLYSLRMSTKIGSACSL